MKLKKIHSKFSNICQTFARNPLAYRDRVIASERDPNLSELVGPKANGHFNSAIRRIRLETIPNGPLGLPDIRRLMDGPRVERFFIERLSLPYGQVITHLPQIVSHASKLSTTSLTDPFWSAYGRLAEGTWGTHPACNRISPFEDSAEKAQSDVMRKLLSESRSAGQVDPIMETILSQRQDSLLRSVHAKKTLQDIYDSYSANRDMPVSLKGMERDFADLVTNIVYMMHETKQMGDTGLVVES